MKKYYGEKEIKTVTDIEEEIVEVIFKDGSTTSMRKSALEKYSSESKKDLNGFEKEKFENISGVLLNEMMDADLSIEELNRFIRHFASKIDAVMDRAMSFVWYNDKNKWIPGVPFEGERKLLEADQILQKIGDDKE